MERRYLTSDEAAAFLGIKKASLYAYVSRGMLSTVPAKPGSRRKLYKKAELERLKYVDARRVDPERAATEAIEFGKPILSTSISLITETEHAYRGVPSRHLARACTFEQVAEFLWTGEATENLDPKDPVLPKPSTAWADPIDMDLAAAETANLTPVERLQCLLPRLEHHDLRAYATNSTQLLPTAIRAIRYLAYFSSREPWQGRVATTLGASWKASPERIDRLLITIADHDLNIATFTARCVASAGSNMYQAILAGLAALQGYKHLYGQIVESRRFFSDVLDTGRPERVLRRYLRNEGSIPGFHNAYQRLYPGQDPRVKTLLSNLEDTDAYPVLKETVDLVESTTGEFPRVDFALGVSEVLLRLPPDAIFDLAAIARTAGMAAHVIEQHGSERVIRPRAKYVGTMRS